MHQIIGQDRLRKLAQPSLQKSTQVMDASALQTRLDFLMFQVEVLLDLLIKIFRLFVVDAMLRVCIKST